MKEIITIDQEKCIGCGACTKSCPVPDALITRKLDDGSLKTTADPDKCIICGKCLGVCGRNAIDYADDTQEFTSLLGKKKLLVIVDPSIRCIYPMQWKGILDKLKKSNCEIYDGGFGADIAMWATISSIESGRYDKLISNICPVAQNYIEMYKPSLIKYLSPVQSPESCCAVYIRTVLEKEEPIVVLTPCIARKADFDKTGIINYTVTFKKLMAHFASKNSYIERSITNDEYNYDGPKGQAGSLIFHSGGMRKNMLSRMPELTVAVSDGTENIIRELDSIDSHSSGNNYTGVLEAMSCSRGCPLGAGAAGKSAAFETASGLINLYEELKTANKGKGVIGVADEKRYKKFDNDLDIEDYLKVYRQGRISTIPSDNDINAAFDSMELKTDEERSCNCGACGYKTCRDMAVAVCRGVNVPESCAVFRSKTMSPAASADDTEARKKLREKLDRISEMMASVTGSSDRIIENAGNAANQTEKIHKFLESVVNYCKSVETMGSKEISQMTGILENTLDAFSVLNKHIDLTDFDSKAISDSVRSINAMMPDLSDVPDKK